MVKYKKYLASNVEAAEDEEEESCCQPLINVIKLSFYLAVVASVSYFGYFLFHDVVVNYLLKNTAPETRICGTGRRDCLAPFRRLDSVFYTSPEHNLAACGVANNMDDLVKAFMCHLSPPAVDSDTHLLGSAVPSTDCPHHDSFNSATANVTDVSQWTVLMLTRDPVDRLVDGYIAECLVETPRIAHCGNSLKDFVENLHDHLLKASDNVEPLPDDNTTRIFSPQTWQCSFDQTLRVLQIVRLDDARGNQEQQNTIKHIQQQLQNIFKSFKPTVFQSIQKSLGAFPDPQMSANVSQSTELTEQLLSSERLMKKLVQIYFYDYVLLNYPMPIEM